MLKLFRYSRKARGMLRAPIAFMSKSTLTIAKTDTVSESTLKHLEHDSLKKRRQATVLFTVSKKSHHRLCFVENPIKTAKRIAL